MTDGTGEDALEVSRLAGLPPLEYDRQREEAATKLGCRVRTLDDLVARCRGEALPANSGQGKGLDLIEPEPWPESVNGAGLLDSLATEIRRFVVLSATDADAVALWVVAAHAFDRFDIFPRLLITAPEKGCGKSTLLDVLEHLVPRPLLASNIRAAALYRAIEAARPTFLLDEADAYARNDEDLRSVLDSGHCRRGFVIRCVGEDNEPRRFSTFCPVVLAAIGRLPGTVEDRSIKIGMRRRRPDEQIESFRLDRASNVMKLARMAARFAADHPVELGAADPAMPPGIINRAADNWRPLIAVADASGGLWPDRARAAALKLARDDEDDSARVLLLADMRQLFDNQPSGVLFTREILAALHDDETRPWPEWKHDKPITGRQVAGLLKEHHIKPKTVRRGEQTDKGYKLEWFEEAFARYLPARSVTPSQLSVSAGIEPGQPVTPSATSTADVTDQLPENPSVSAGCDAVTAGASVRWRERI